MVKTKKIEFSSGQISASLAPFGVRLSAKQTEQVHLYINLLLKWNELLSLTSIVDPIEITTRHFGESMFLASILPVENCRLADVGSGAGFPGLALKIICPDLHVFLIESNRKKSAFLSEVARSLELDGVEVIPDRYDQIHRGPEFANVVTARAVGDFPRLLRWSKAILARRGHLALWVGGEDTVKISGTLGWNWQPAVRIPESQRRFILIGRPLPE